MQTHVQAYRQYLPSDRQLMIIAGALLVLLLVPSISFTIFGQSNDVNAVTDQTVQIVNDVQADEKPADTQETPSTDQTTEAPAATDETPSSPDIDEVAEETAKTPTPDASDLPTTGPAETLSATIGIIALAIGYRHFMRSRALVSRSLTTKKS